MIRQLPSSPRSIVWLAEFDGEPAVVKQTTGGADVEQRYATESTALSIAGRAGPPVVPLVLAADPDARMLVLEYLVDQDVPPGRWMTEYATSLARLHATGRPADRGALPSWRGPAQADADAFVDLAARLGVEVPAGLAGELATLTGRLRATGGEPTAGPAGPAASAGEGKGGYALLHRLTALAALGAGHPRLSALAQVSEGMRREMLTRYTGLLPLPAARDNPVLNYRA